MDGWDWSLQRKRGGARALKRRSWEVVSLRRGGICKETSRKEEGPDGRSRPQWGGVGGRLKQEAELPVRGGGGGGSDVDALGVETRRQGALQHSEVIGQLAGGGWPLQQIRLQGRVYTQENQRETILDLAACTLSNQPQLLRKSC